MGTKLSGLELEEQVHLTQELLVAMHWCFGGQTSFQFPLSRPPPPSMGCVMRPVRKDILFPEEPRFPGHSVSGSCGGTSQICPGKSIYLQGC